MGIKVISVVPFTDALLLLLLKEPLDGSFSGWSLALPHCRALDLNPSGTLLLLLSHGCDWLVCQNRFFVTVTTSVLLFGSRLPFVVLIHTFTVCRSHSLALLVQFYRTLQLSPLFFLVAVPLSLVVSFTSVSFAILTSLTQA